MVKINKKQAFVISLIVAVIFLAIPHLRIITNPGFISSESYYHLRIMETIEEKGIIMKDVMVFGERPYVFNLSHYLFFKLYPKIMIRLAPFIFGILTALIFYKILDNFKIKDKQKLLIFLLFVSSPVFIYIFSTFNSYFIALFLTVAAFYLTMRNKFGYSLLLILLIPFFNMTFVPIIIGLLLFYYLKSKEYKKCLISCIPLFIISSILYVSVFRYNLPEVAFFANTSFSKNLVSDFGSFYGFSAFFLILTAIGVFVLWEKKKEYINLYILGSTFFVLSIYFSFLNIFLNFIFSFFAAAGLISIMQRKWEYKLIKNATILLILCGLLFSTTSFINRLYDIEPTTAQINGMGYLSLFPKQETVFSHYKNGYLLEYISGLPVILDENFVITDNVNERYNDTQTIFYSRDLEHTKALLDKYNVGYIWIDESMKSGLVWNKKDQGLLFLFRNEETFKNTYSFEGAEIWKYVK